MVICAVGAIIPIMILTAFAATVCGSAVEAADGGFSKYQAWMKVDGARLYVCVAHELDGICYLSGSASFRIGEMEQDKGNSSVSLGPTAMMTSTSVVDSTRGHWVQVGAVRGQRGIDALRSSPPRHSPYMIIYQTEYRNELLAEGMIHFDVLRRGPDGDWSQWAMAMSVLPPNKEAK